MGRNVHFVTDCTSSSTFRKYSIHPVILEHAALALDCAKRHCGSYCQGRLSPLTPMTQTPPPLSFLLLPLSLPPLFPSFPFLNTPFPLSLLPLSPPFPFPSRPPESARSLGSPLAPPARSGAEPRPLMHSG